MRRHNPVAADIDVTDNLIAFAVFSLPAHTCHQV